jgi:hypothetical protein
MAYRVLNDGQILAEEGDADAARAAFAAHPGALVWRWANQALWAEVLGEVQSKVRGVASVCARCSGQTLDTLTPTYTHNHIK